MDPRAWSYAETHSYVAVSPSDLGVEVPSGVEKIFAKVLYLPGGGCGSSSGGTAVIPTNVLRQDTNDPYLKTSKINELVNGKVSAFITSTEAETLISNSTSNFVTSDNVNTLISNSTVNFITSDAVTTLVTSQVSALITENKVDDKINSLSATYATKEELTQLGQTLNVSAQIEDISTRLSKLETYLGLSPEPQENPENLQEIIASLKNRILQLEAASGTTDMGGRLEDPQNSITLSDREDESTTLIYGDRT